MRKKRVGFFGGTFDPPHLGHEILAREALYQLELDEFHWLITPVSPHKQSQLISPIGQRLSMLACVLGSCPSYRLSRLDLDRSPPYYAADTVEMIKRDSPSQTLVYILGEDSLVDLPAWYQPARFLAGIDLLAVAPRPGVQASLADLEGVLPGLSAKCIYLKDVMVEISSRLIRQRVKHNAPYRHFLNPAVADYIAEHRLYSS